MIIKILLIYSPELKKYIFSIKVIRNIGIQSFILFQKQWLLKKFSNEC